LDTNLQLNDESVNAEDDYIKMDYTLLSAAERVEKAKEILANTPSSNLNPSYIEKISDYIIYAMDKEEKKQKKIITDNRMVTVNKRETSFEGLVGKLENGEDSIYNIMTNDKNIIFSPKVGITEEDIETIPGLKELREGIAKVEEECKTARGKRAYQLKKQLIEMRQDQYVLKNMYKKPTYAINIAKNLSKIDLSENITIDKDGEVTSSGIISLFNPKHISALLCNYSQIKEEC